ncbi:MAG: hypothetical protein A2Z29_05400 [Chloroflexi bacterium RBG_16_56_11]|nr:MAG: hypothetical protein A2Z29_05400 [Chloroflexi bacterium RBG_16_56_11]
MVSKQVMLKKIGATGLVIFLLVVVLLAVAWLTPSNSEDGMTKDIGISAPGLTAIDYSSVPQAIIDDAVGLAGELVGHSQQKLQRLADQLVATYLEARNKDVIVIFNSGGWGWSTARQGEGWATIIDGIRSQLDDLGYSSAVVNYRRTSGGLWGCIKEFIEAARRYPHKARDLAMRVEFLTDHLPGLKIIVAGESTGTVITDKTMAFLKDKSQVYSIQTGMPFWNSPVTFDRTLLVNSNGKGIDTFSRGNVPAMVWATFKSWLGLSSPDDVPGDILSWLKAPGHDYSWQYPGVYDQVIKFLDQNFDKKRP